MIDIIVILILITVGYVSGSYFEQKHYISIKKREKQTLHVPVVTFGKKNILPEASQAKLFTGSVVVSADYFKTFAFALRNLVGGKVVVYESLLDRGRREAMLRMKENAMSWGATQIYNVRYETSNIGNQNRRSGLVAIEVMAYGTGIK